MSLLAILLDLPAFLVGVFFLYWSVPLAVITRRVKAFKLTGLRNDAYGWAAGIKDSFGVNMLRMAGPDLYRDGTCVYLSNHRSWADFFLDVIATEGRAQMLSRMAVFFVFPMFMIPVRVVRGVILFKRGTIRDKEKFNIMVDASMHDSPMNGLIVYPEGHRSTRRASLPLKRGMLHYVFSRKHLVQIVMSSNKEAIISEKTLSAHFRQTVVVGYSEVIRSSDFGTFEEFVAAVQKAWDAEWARVYAADWNAPMTSFPENIDDQPDIFTLTMLSE
ncbi:hypothetical protein WJX72_008180 [[Myrmecia] bisecta]|uniref:Phospholipid/glycerol acyltransferase domain-containing protein n=1 Tax=[Myrmecia] bisecta TaxID=41462 RepID=A0AAW1Q4D6_9CHLO